MMKPEEELCYIAIHRDCGGWQGIIVISYEKVRLKTIANDVAEWIRAGLQVETWTVAKVREEAKMCQCLKKTKSK